MVNIVDLHFISEPELAPRPREEIEITELQVLRLDSTRYRVNISITPFAPVDRPNLEIIMTDSQGRVLGSANVIEAVQYKITLILHQRAGRGDMESGPLEFTANLYFEPGIFQHTVSNQLANT